MHNKYTHSRNGFLLHNARGSTSGSQCIPFDCVPSIALRVHIHIRNRFFRVHALSADSSIPVALLCCF